MQTFLPYPNFEDSAKVLDQKRLGKQRVETFQLMQRLAGLKLISSVCVGYRETWEYNEDLDEWFCHFVPISRPLPEELWTVHPIRGTAWSSHPAARMWRGYEKAFLEYQRATVEEWLSRGYEDTCWRKTLYVYREKFPWGKLREPFWLGDYDFHISHQSNLVAKNPDYYRPMFPTVPDDLEYIWPVDEKES